MGAQVRLFAGRFVSIPRRGAHPDTTRAGAGPDEALIVFGLKAEKSGEIELKLQNIQIAEKEVERQKLELSATVREQADARKYEVERNADAAQYRIEREAAAERLARG